ncbi:MAG: hypothetical protein OQK48_04815 [Sulfurimonas sp.]|uniref:hypothetical protein n=1 Tax=Sulfurimonas sp. TaxID=2022749 RepID=UPI0026276E75|nr:hypothetical protein [Sulfurimonas sp.]MCW8894342.1 hypothetical protein [Sulfurimonas sp.]MCW8954245.1 hypothetical protein [Sulfurimonas sp.]MCW9066835.1 hypothetical protein [Sulfurimonas sp.]
MKYIMISQIFLSGLFAHGFAHEHLHFFDSLHVEYFVLFIAGLVSAFFIYEKVFKGNR